MWKYAFISLLIWCSACSHPGRIVGAKPAVLIQPHELTVLFNHREQAGYISPISGRWRPGDDLEQALIQAIKSADKEILVAMQEVSLPDVAGALIEARNGGVEVKVVLENNYSRPWSWESITTLTSHQRQRRNRLQRLADRDGDGDLTTTEAASGDAVALLLEAGVPLIDDTADGSRGSGLMHHKFLVIDQEIVLTGSANTTSSGIHGDAGAASTRGNVNHLLRLKSKALAQLFRNEFHRLWGDGPGGQNDSRFGLQKQSGPAQSARVGDAKVEVLFAPHSKSNPNHGLNVLEKQLAEAEKSIDLALFVFSAQQLADVLQERANDGVKIRLIADPGFASRPFSEVLDLLGVALPDQNCRLERGNRPFQKPLRGVGTPRLARGDKLHHKFAVVDNKTVITGSFNWSPAAAHTNDETLLVIHSPKLAAHFTREMDRLWNNAELGITPHIQRKLDRQRIRCGDGVERR
ncbi:phospholipase D-like domain-containing protein [Synechococcus sp. MIT S1220]|uniref:phospholipase D-like domain-containing protein n=1 Tax=Synechococcus sp. MIT S1220 TaxID=3082549 RepID=UPI0039AEF468